MDKVIKHFMKKALSGEDILDMIDHKASLIPNSELYKYSNIDQVLGEHGACVLLYDRKDGRAGHWSCLVRKDKNTLIFFCPYGFAPDQALRYMEGYPYLTKLLKKSHYDVIYSNKRLQKYIKDVNVCGRWVAGFLILKHIPLDIFIKLFTKNKYYDPDFFITALTVFNDK